MPHESIRTFIALELNTVTKEKIAAIQDTLNPDRVIIGEYDTKGGTILEEFYRSFYMKRVPPILRMNLKVRLWIFLRSLN